MDDSWCGPTSLEPCTVSLNSVIAIQLRRIVARTFPYLVYDVIVHVAHFQNAPNLHYVYIQFVLPTRTVHSHLR
jgi:hypothetical protein